MGLEGVKIKVTPVAMVCAEDKVRLVALFTAATVTTPEMPVPDTTSFTSMFVLDTMVKAVELLMAPLETALVAKSSI